LLIKLIKTKAYLSYMSALIASNSSVLSIYTGNVAWNFIFYILVSRIWRLATARYKIHNRVLANFEYDYHSKTCGLLTTFLWYPISCASNI